MRLGSPAAPATLFAALWLSGLPAGQAHADTLERSFEVKPDVRVEIELLSGEIELRAIDANELRVRADRELEIDAATSGRRVSIRAPSSVWRPWAGGASVDLEVELPRNSRITARTGNGKIEAEGVAGELVLHSANGEIEVEGAPPEAYLETMNAAIKFEGERSEVVARTLNGEIELQGVTGAVEASTLSGRIKVEGDAIERAELRTMSGEIELDSSLAEGARVEAKTYSGQVRLRLPDDASARFDVQSFSGGIESDFSSQRFDVEDDPGGWRHGPGRRRSFVIGEGDARISIESFSGGVKIEQRGR
jgi:formylmethanofuran dehydrogenase subunit C